MFNDIVKIGVVGAGKLGSYHIRKLLSKENCDFIGIYDVDLKIMKDFEDRYNINIFNASLPHGVDYPRKVSFEINARW